MTATPWPACSAASQPVVARGGETGVYDPLLAGARLATLDGAVRDGAPFTFIEEGVSEVAQTLVTARGFERLEREHARLRAERERLVQRLRAALEFGGALPENGEYLDARHELDLLERRFRAIEDRLIGAKVVEARPDGEVDLGERVTVLDLESGVTGDYRVVGSGESDPEAGEISYQSPIGAALLGRRVGDVVVAEVPGGRRRLEIVELDG